MNERDGFGRRGNVVYLDDGSAVHAETGKSVPLNVWLKTGTATDDPYPCRCSPPGRCGRQCPCRGRTGALEHLTGTCCAHRKGRDEPRNVVDLPSRRRGVRDRVDRLEVVPTAQRR